MHCFQDGFFSPFSLFYIPLSVLGFSEIPFIFSFFRDVTRGLAIWFFLSSFFFSVAHFLFLFTFS